MFFFWGGGTYSCFFSLSITWLDIAVVDVDDDGAGAAATAATASAAATSVVVLRSCLVAAAFLACAYFELVCACCLNAARSV